MEAILVADLSMTESTQRELKEIEPVVRINDGPEAPLVSVLVTTYQHEAYIARCLDSILSQKTDFAFEILLGEDASTDATREICLEYAKRHPDHIRLFLHNDANRIPIFGKQSGRFNVIYTLSQARGAFIAICDGDDHFSHPEKLQRQVDFLVQNPDYSACVHALDVVDAERGHLFVTNLSKGIQINKQDPYWNATIAPVAMMYRRELVDPTELMGEFYSADLVILMLCIQKGPIWFMEDVMAVYYRHGGSRTQSLDYLGNGRRFIGLLNCLSSVRRTIKAKGGSTRWILPRVAEVHFRFAVVSLRTGRVGNALRQSVMGLGFTMASPVRTVRRIARVRRSDRRNKKQFSWNG